MPVISDPFLSVMLDSDVLVFFGVHENLFVSFFILEPDFIEALAAFAAVGFDRGHRGVVRERVRRFGLAVIDRAGDDWAIGIAFEKFHDDLLAYAGQKNRAPILARPGLRNAHPTRRVLVGRTVAVPMELHFDAPEFIGENFLARLANHDRGLRSLNARLLRHPRRAKNAAGWNGRKLAQESLLSGLPAPATRLVSFSTTVIGHAGNQVFVILILAGMALELEFASTDQTRAVRLAHDDVVLGLEFFDAHLAVAVAVVA